MISKVNADGRITIPAEIRRRYCIAPRTKLKWIDTGRIITVLPILKGLETVQLPYKKVS